MTLSELSDLVGIVSGAAVAISLVYLTFQIRQNARHQRGTISHSRSANVQLLMQTVAGSDALTETMVRGWTGDQTLEPVRINQFYWVASAVFTMFQDTFHQRREGMVSALTYASAVRTMTFQISQPGMRAAWLLNRPSFEPSFAAFIDQLMRDTPVAATGDMAARWRALAAEQQAAG